MYIALKKRALLYPNIESDKVWRKFYNWCGILFIAFKYLTSLCSSHVQVLCSWWLSLSEINIENKHRFRTRRTVRAMKNTKN